MEILKSIQDFVKLDTMELAQKAKIKWAIEGDENSKYYHGVLNKKRNQLAIRGILVEGFTDKHAQKKTHGISCSSDKGGIRAAKKKWMCNSSRCPSSYLVQSWLPLCLGFKRGARIVNNILTSVYLGKEVEDLINGEG
ncbi:hypothetical protein Tco_0878097 [Tanacetum coccineum]|uniref:RNA-directed DNA polymerase, eukaryota n=1 Tax=Tanacetum coccineum TaxID=301880 RepID=A0ABQ5BXF5_9ASTR